MTNGRPLATWCNTRLGPVTGQNLTTMTAPGFHWNWPSCGLLMVTGSINTLSAQSQLFQTKLSCSSEELVLVQTQKPEGHLLWLGLTSSLVGDSSSLDRSSDENLDPARSSS